MKHPIALLVLAASAASAQHHGHGPGHAPSPYAGETSRAIKALSAEEERAWIEGQGMGLARAAELNGYPGPMHVLELAAPLRLTAQQADATRSLMDRHKAEVRQLGTRLVELERRLDVAFRERHATDAEVDRLTAEVAQLQGRIRAAHLRTHLAQTALLTSEQVTRYGVLRGYAR